MVDPYAPFSRVTEGEIIPRLIECEIIPRMVRAQRMAVQRSLATAVAAGPRPGPEEVAELVCLVVEQGEAAAASFVEGLLARGITLDKVFVELLTPAARRLGGLWADDRIAFADVTIGLSRLQWLMRQFSHEFQLDGAPTDRGRRALLSPCAGERHNFGILMVAEFLSRAGWDVHCTVTGMQREVVRTLRNQDFAMLGLSLHCDGLLEALAGTIAAARGASRNPDIRVIVGGRVFIDNPDLVHRIGADAMAFDGRHAVREAEALSAHLSMAC